jgi:hypothetical protein
MGKSTTFPIQLCVKESSTGPLADLDSLPISSTHSVSSPENEGEKEVQFKFSRFDDGMSE